VVDAQRLINAILLGDATYDAVLLELWPGPAWRGVKGTRVIAVVSTPADARDLPEGAAVTADRYLRGAPAWTSAEPSS
jgi:hypothetical protein